MKNKIIAILSFFGAILGALFFYEKSKAKDLKVEADEQKLKTEDAKLSQHTQDLKADTEAYAAQIEKEKQQQMSPEELNNFLKKNL